MEEKLFKFASRSQVAQSVERLLKSPLKEVKLSDVGLNPGHDISP